MNIDKAIETLEQGFQTPDTSIKKVAIPDADMPNYSLRRKDKGAQTHWVWMISVGERGQAPLANFLEHTLKKAFTKALAWRGVQPQTRAPRKKNGAAAQHQAAP